MYGIVLDLSVDLIAQLRWHLLWQKKAPLFFPFCVTASKSKWAQGAEPTTTAASFKGGWVKIKQYPLAETANYHVWSLLEYLMIFFLQATKKCPGVIGSILGLSLNIFLLRWRQHLPKLPFARWNKPLLCVTLSDFKRKRAWFSNRGCESTLSCASVCCSI